MFEENLLEKEVGMKATNFGFVELLKGVGV